MPTVECMKRAAEHRTDGQYTAHRQKPDDADDSSDGEVLETMTKGNALVSQ